jgi:DNA-binding transcriptional LysR family regulator
MLYQAMLGCRDRARADLCRGKDLAEGRMVSLMPDYKPVESELSAIYPPGENPSAKVRSLIDFIAARFGPEPPWDE